MRTTNLTLATVTAITTLSALAVSPAVSGEALSDIDEATVAVVRAHLAREGVKGIDFSAKSGEYCINAGLPGGGHMTHYAVDAEATREDIVDFVHAGSLMEAGLDVETLPRHPGTLGAMEPGRWYYVPADEFEPHHATRFPFPLIVRATDTN